MPLTRFCNRANITHTCFKICYKIGLHNKTEVRDSDRKTIREDVTFPKLYQSYLSPCFLVFAHFPFFASLTFPPEPMLTATVNPSASDKCSHPRESEPDVAPKRLLFKRNVLPTNFTKLEHIRAKLESWRYGRGQRFAKAL